MIVDSSVLLAIAFRDEGSAELVDRIIHASVAAVGVSTLSETAIILHAKLGDRSRGIVERLVDELGLAVLPFGEEHWKEAVDAYRRFGKGQHAAKLTFANCMTYAMARLSAQPLLFTSDGFARTDVEVA